MLFGDTDAPGSACEILTFSPPHFVQNNDNTHLSWS